MWSPLEYIAHTRDAISWYAARVDRILTEQQAKLSPFDWDAYTVTRRYDERQLDDVLDELDATGSDFADKLTQLTGEQWKRYGIGSDGGRRTITDLADRAAHEACHHGFDVRMGLTSGRD